MCCCRALVPVALATSLGAWSCSKGPAPSAAAAAEVERDASSDRIRLPEAVIRDANIQTGPVTREVLSAVLPLPGEITADPDKSARLSSPAAGRIETVSFREGARVTKGEVLATIRIPELGKLRGAYVATLDRAKAARSNADRQKDLSEHRVAAAQAYVDAVATADALEAEANALGEQLATLGAGSTAGPSQLALRAPVSGVVISRDAVIGQPVTPDRTLGSIADLSEVWFLAHVYEKDLGRVRLGATAAIELAAYPEKPFEGIVEYVGQQIDAASRSFTARIRVVNRDDLLRIGLFGTARIATGDGGGAPTLVVPRPAVVEIGGQSVVFVRSGDDFERRDVSLGTQSSDRVEVRSGVREGEQVVVEGAFAVKSALLKAAFAE